MPPRGWFLNASPLRILEEIGLEEGVSKGLFLAANELRNTWIEHLSRQGSGRLYRRGGVVHQASAPGEPPAPDTGILRGSITEDFEITEDAEGFSTFVGSSAAYAPILEFGVPPGSHPNDVVIEPRPHARPAFDEATPKMREEFKRAVLAQARRRFPRGGRESP